MGTHRPNSDIDLCLDAPDMSFPTHLQLAADLDEQLLPYSLDLVLKDKMAHDGLEINQKTASEHIFLIRSDAV